MVLALEREPRQKRQWGQVVARAWEDDAYRRRLLAEPASVLCEAGIAVPPGVAVRVVEGDVAEDPEDEPCFWLPPGPADEDLVADDIGLPPDVPRMIHGSYTGRTKPAPVARLPLPARPAADDLIADDLGLPPDAVSITRSGVKTYTKPR
jgi:hypothetical protein